jgi:hypothetical protein
MMTIWNFSMRRNSLKERWRKDRDAWKRSKESMNKARINRLKHPPKFNQFQLL